MNAQYRGRPRRRPQRRVERVAVAGLRHVGVTAIRLLGCVIVAQWACVGADGPGPGDSFEGGGDDGLILGVVGSEPQPGARRSVAYASAGWIDALESPVVPWCGATLVDSQIALTASACVAGLSSGDLAVGFGTAGRASMYEVEDVFALESDPRLAGIVLDRPVVDIGPARVGPAAPMGCSVSAVSHQFVIRGDHGRRWVWSGCLHGADEVRAERGGPNCHGDLGGPLFVTDRQGTEELIGIVVGVVATGDGSCVTTSIMAAVTDLDL